MGGCSCVLRLVSLPVGAMGLDGSGLLAVLPAPASLPTASQAFQQQVFGWILYKLRVEGRRAPLGPPDPGVGDGDRAGGLILVQSLGSTAGEKDSMSPWVSGDPAVGVSRGHGTPCPGHRAAMRGLPGVRSPQQTPAGPLVHNQLLISTFRPARAPIPGAPGWCLHSLDAVS